jgi:hypothetical protein
MRDVMRKIKGKCPQGMKRQKRLKKIVQKEAIKGRIKRAVQNDCDDYNIKYIMY